jgi:hypothetical protein
MLPSTLGARHARARLHVRPTEPWFAGRRPIIRFPSLMALLLGSTFLGASLTVVAVTWLCFSDVELALLLAPTGGIVAAIVVAGIFDNVTTLK